MNTIELKKIVSDAYKISETDSVVPKFSTQFIFKDNEICVRIPIHECQPPSSQLLVLICRVINTALPNLRKKQEVLEQDLLTAAAGREVNSRELCISGVVVGSTNVSDGASVHAVTECIVRAREIAELHEADR